MESTATAQKQFVKSSKHYEQDSRESFAESEGKKARKIRGTLRVREIQTDRRFQRAIRADHVSAIASAFDLDCVGTIVVALISGVYYVIDGQHRLEAMRSLDMLDVEVECEIYVDPTMEYAAKLFLALNARKGMKLFDKFEKRVNSGDPVAVDIVETVRSLGLEIHEYLRGAINAVDALERVYLDKRGKRSSPSPSALRTTLRCLRDAWGEDESAYNGNLIKALGAVVRRYDGMIDQENMIRHMVAFPGGPSGLLRRGKELATVKRLATIHAIAEEFVSLYNHRLRSNTLDPWMKSRRP